MLMGPRVRLRGWTDQDRAPYAALNADPEVRRFFPGLLDRAASDAQIDAFVAHEQAHGFTLWALEIPGVLPCAGFVGLYRVGPEMPFAPAVEIGWRLARSGWGHGYATEAAALCLQHAWTVLGLAQVVAYAVPQNQRSIAVMQRLGMREAGRFANPAMPWWHRLRRNVLYRIDAPPSPGEPTPGPARGP
jgi:RimJ/RimL family protein N-acetyltransferase